MVKEYKYCAFGDINRIASVDKPWPDDVANREEFARSLIRFINAQKLPTVIALNGRWGTGKTYFLRGFEQFVNYQGDGKYCPTCIYLNAWEADNLKNPLLYLYHGIDCAAQKIGSMIDPETRQVMADNAHQLFINFANVFTAGLAGKVGKGLSENCADHLCNQYEEFQRGRENLRKYLLELGAWVKKTYNTPLLICLDELDRCRPDYAIEMLETIKHMFSIPNVVFVLGMDIEQLGKSIQARYGNIAIDEYLRRFIHYKIDLPLLSNSQYFSLLWNEWEIGEQILKCIAANSPANKFEPVEVLNLFTLLLDQNRCTPRQLESIARMFLTGLSERIYQFTDCAILAIISCLSVFSPELFNAYMHGKVDINKISAGLVAEGYGAEDWNIALKSLVNVIVRISQVKNSTEMGEIFSLLHTEVLKKSPELEDIGSIVERLNEDCMRGGEGFERDFPGTKQAELFGRINLCAETNTQWIRFRK